MGTTIILTGFYECPNVDMLKTHLEWDLGLGAVVAIRPLYAYAKEMEVQFRKLVPLDQVLHRVNSGEIRYYRTRMNARQVPYDIDKNAYDFDEDGVTLQFGTQVSKKRFDVLHTKPNALVRFSEKRQKFSFIVTHLNTTYKMELPCTVIWDVVVYGTVVAIELYGAPFIYQKATADSHMYYRDPPPKFWMRTTDFTQGLMGQSFRMCMEFGSHVDLSMIVKNLRNLREAQYRKSFIEFMRGTSFCARMDLVPIVQPDFNLPYRIIYKISSLVQQGCIPGPLVNSDFYQLCDPNRGREISSIIDMLHKLYSYRSDCYNPTECMRAIYRESNGLQTVTPELANPNLVTVRRIQITPSRIYFSEPKTTHSNGVLQKYAEYADHFIYVRFVDEDFQKLHASTMMSNISQHQKRRSAVYDRILSILSSGIHIGDRHFQFLAFSQSQLKSNSVWMFAPAGELDADVIRRWMGDFTSIKHVGKFAARLGQTFSSSMKSATVQAGEIEKIDDIERVTNGVKYIFSDGIGKISKDFAKEVSDLCECGYIPSAYQIRCGGYKGVVVIDPEASQSSTKLYLRTSMCKFESENKEVDVIDISKYRPLFINRQFIILLSTLGVKDDVFEKKQQEDLELLDGILTDPIKAEEAVVKMPPILVRAL